MNHSLWLSSSGWCLRICVSHKLSGDANAGFPAPVWEQLPWVILMNINIWHPPNKITNMKDITGGTVVETPSSQCRGHWHAEWQKWTYTPEMKTNSWRSGKDLGGVWVDQNYPLFNWFLDVWSLSRRGVCAGNLGLWKLSLSRVGGCVGGCVCVCPGNLGLWKLSLSRGVCVCVCVCVCMCVCVCAVSKRLDEKKATPSVSEWVSVGNLGLWKLSLSRGVCVCVCVCAVSKRLDEKKATPSVASPLFGEMLVSDLPPLTLAIASSRYWACIPTWYRGMSVWGSRE